MLSEEIIEKLEERLVQRITNANLFVIKKIAKKIKEMGTIQPSNSFDVMNMLNYGGDLDKITEEIAKETELNVEDIYKIFEEVAKNDQNFAKQFYKYKNKKFIPWKDNEFLRREVDALAELTANNYVNMAKTSGVGYTVKDNEGNTIFKDISTLYKDMVDDGLVSLSQGKTSFDEEMGRLMKQIAMSGLKYVEYESGHTRRLDSALRMNLNDGLKKLHNKSQEIFGREFGADGVEVSVHNNPAPDHEQVQGRQFSTIRPSENELSEWEKFENDQDCKSYDGIEFPAVSEETGRDRRSISEYNCKHYTFAIVLGVSKPQYTNEQLQTIIDKNEKGFEFEGKHYTMYEGTQLQRKIETQIRKNMDLQIMGRESGRDDLVEDAQENIDQLTNKYYDLSKASGLSTKLERMQVENYREIKLKDNTPPTDKINALKSTLQEQEKPKVGDFDRFRERLDNNKALIDLQDEFDVKDFFEEYNKFYDTLDKKELEKVDEEYENWTKKTSKSQPVGKFLNEKLGYDAKPELISKDEFFVDEDGERIDDTKEHLYDMLDKNHWYRGVNATRYSKILDQEVPDRELTKRYVDEFKDGEYFAGVGINGNGTYITTSYSYATRYSRDIEEGMIFIMPKENIKYIDVHKINWLSNTLYRYIDNYRDADDVLYFKISRYIIGDPGYLASLLGYDIIDESDIKVVLNRGAIKVVK